MSLANIAECKNCCMCYACVNVCPQRCIDVKKNKYGELYPYVDEKRCTECGLCRQICPVIEKAQANKPKQVYVACSKSKAVHGNSSSGGIAWELAKYILSCNAIVYGTALVGLEARVCRISDEKDLHKITGSKYLHSHIGTTLSEISADLKNGKTVLVIGTPCQIAAVKKFIPQKYKSLYLVDILCHGAPSQDCFESGIKIETQDEVNAVRFRNGAVYELNIDTKNSGVINIPYRASYWLNAFLEGMIFRENCYSCQYAGEQRVGDITLGDFWGLNSSSALYKKRQMGLSMVLVNSDAGAELLEKIKNNIELEQRSLDEAKKDNHSLSNPADKPKQYEKFKKVYAKKGGKSAILKYDIKKTIYIKIRRAVRKNHILFSALSKLPYIGSKL